MAITMQSDCLQGYWKNAKQVCRPCSVPLNSYQELLCACEADKDAVISCVPSSDGAGACRSRAEALAECIRRGYTTATSSTITTAAMTSNSSSSSGAASGVTATMSASAAMLMLSSQSPSQRNDATSDSLYSSLAGILTGVLFAIGFFVFVLRLILCQNRRKLNCRRSRDKLKTKYVDDHDKGQPLIGPSSSGSPANPSCAIAGAQITGTAIEEPYKTMLMKAVGGLSDDLTGATGNFIIFSLPPPQVTHNSLVINQIGNGNIVNHSQAGGSFLPANGSANVEANEDVIEHIDSEHVSESTGLLDYGSDDRNRPVPGDPITNDSSQPLPAAIYPNISSDEDAPGNRSIVESSSEAVDSRLPPGNTGEVNTGVNDRVTPGTEGAADIGLSNACSEATDDNEASEGSGLPDRGTGDRKFPSNGSSTGHADTTNDDSLNNDCASADSSRLLASDKTLPVPEENKDDFKQAPMESPPLPESLQSC